MALTGQAPFNRRQFTSFALANVKDAPVPPFVGSGAAAESQDAVAGSGGTQAPAVVSSLNPKAIGPLSRFNKFRQPLNGISNTIVGSGAITEGSDIAVGAGAQSTSGSGAITEQPDVGTGSGNGSPAPVIGSITPLNYGPQNRVSKFRSRLADSLAPPPVFASGLGAAVESSDIAAGTGSVSVPSVSSLNTANLGPSFSAPFNVNQFKALQQGATSQPAIVGVAAITESSDVATGSGSTSISGSAAITEATDIVSGSGAAGSIGIGATVESPDVATASGSQLTSGSAVISEAADVVAGSGSTSLSGSAAITESADTAFGVGGSSGLGAGAATESPDVINASGTQSISGAAAVVESADVASGAGSAAAVASASIVEQVDTVLASGSTQNVGSAGITEAADTVVGIGIAISVFAPRYLIEAPAQTRLIRRQRLAMQSGPLPYAEFFMRVGEKESFGIDWAPWLANRWTSGALVALGFTIRPSTPNGYQFPCTIAGASAATEPLWPAVPGAIIIEGGVTWTCQPIDTNSLAETVVSAIWAVPTGVVVNSSGLVGQIVSAIFDVTTAIAGTDYMVKCNTTMSDGEVRIGQFKLKVR